MDKIKLDRIEDAIEDIKNGKIVIVVDDEDRENEGDFICAAEHVTPEIVNFMRKVAGGYLCCAVTAERCDELELDLMVGRNTDPNKTAFTVTVDLLGHGCTTGISASDRAKTIQALADDRTKPEDLGRPGHINPLKAMDGGVLRRAGHTEAAVDLPRLAGLKPTGVLIEVLNEDGTMARLPDLVKVAKKYDMKLISIADLIEYRLQHDSLIERVIGVEMPTAYGDFDLLAFRQKETDQTHLALIKGEWTEDEPVLVRVHSSCVLGDVFGSFRGNSGTQLQTAMQVVEKEGKGVVLYMNQEGRGLDLIKKLKAYKLQERGLDTEEANLELGYQMDQRDYGIGAQILRSLGVRKMKLLSNSPKKRAGLIGYGLEITERVPVEVPSSEDSPKYAEAEDVK